MMNQVATRTVVAMNNHVVGKVDTSNLPVNDAANTILLGGLVVFIAIVLGLGVLMFMDVYKMKNL